MDDTLNDLIANITNEIASNAGIGTGWLVLSSDLINLSAGVAQAAGNIALLLTTVYFMLEINMRMVTDGGGTPVKTWVGSILKYAIAAYLVGSGGTMTAHAQKLANALLLSLPSGVAEEANPLESVAVVDSLAATFAANPPAFFMKMFMLVCLLLGTAATWICGIVWIYKSITYRIEFSFRLCLYPFALADAYQGNTSTAVRYIKSIIGMGIYGAAFILIPRLGAYVMKDMLEEAFNVAQVSVDPGDVAWKSVENATGITLIKGLAVCLSVPAAEIGCLGLCKQAVKEYLA